MARTARLGWVVVMLAVAPTGAIADEASPAESAPVSVPLRWEGDVRLRSELLFFDQEATPEQDELPTSYRGRLRFRLGFERDLSPGLVFGVRLASGSSNPTSGNVTLGDEFGKKAFGLDRVFLRFQPIEAVTVMAGKLQSPLFDRELLWDGDVGPEGLAESARLGSGQVVLSASAGQFVLGDLEETARDPWLFVGQLEAAITATPAIELEVGVGYYHYVNLDRAPLPYDQGTNSHGDDDLLRYAFHIPVVLAALELATAWKPIAAHVELSRNLAAPRGQDGAQAEVRIGTIAAAGDWSAGYLYQRLERDATLDSLSESHWHKQRTNYDGHALNGKLAVRAGWVVSSSLKLMRSIDGPRDDETRWTLDTIAEL